MILSNFIKVMSCGINSTMPKSTAGITKMAYLADTRNFSSLNFSRYNNIDENGDTYTLKMSYLGIALSSDTAVPTVDDYQFTNFYRSSDLVSVDASLNDGPMQTVLTQTVRNDGTQNVVINSVGIFGYAATINTIVLLTKTLLDTPVTVAPGETKTITVTIDYNSFVENVNA